VSSKDPLPPLSEEERRGLLDLARQAILAALAGDPPPAPGHLPIRLQDSQGAFVTLRVRGRLRGCIGTIEPVEPLWHTILHCAVASAFEDPRFPPLTGADLPGLEIEISALAPPRPVRDVSEIRVGRDGLIVSMGRRRGLLLPQVPVEQGWDPETFLRETCRKAGLEPDAPGRGARIEAFEAQIFTERSPVAPPGEPSRGGI
jgi:AmmeMemoRadiSam system protein A